MKRSASRRSARLAVPCCWCSPGCSSGGDDRRQLAAASSSATRRRHRPRASPTPTPTPDPSPTADPGAAPPPPPPTDPLTGGAGREGPVIAVKIDNTVRRVSRSTASSDADIVYVEQVEGGLTRLMAVFHTTLPTEVGAVRSVRTTDAELLPVFGTPALVFSGGGGVRSSALANTPVIPVVAGRRRAGGFWRSAAARAPYNLHADLQTGRRQRSAGSARPNNIGFAFAATDPRVDAAPPATSMAVQFQAARMEFGLDDGRYRLIRQRRRAQSDASGAPIVADNVLFQNVGLRARRRVRFRRLPVVHLAHRRQRDLHPVPGRPRDRPGPGAGPRPTSRPSSWTAPGSRCRSSPARPGWRWCRRPRRSSS